jgi:hypothetical protein
MISGIHIPAGPVDQPTFTYVHRETFNLDDIHLYLGGADVFDSVMLGKNQVMYVDDLGRPKNLSLNAIGTALYQRLRGGDFIVGDVLILGYDDEGETCSVSTDTLLVVAKIASALAREDFPL